MHDEDGVGDVFQPVEAVVHDQNGAAFGLQGGERLRERFGGLGIKVGARLVENQHLGAQRQNVREPHLLLLAFGEGVDVLLQKIGEAESIRGRGNARLDVVRGHAAASQRKGDFVAHGKREELLLRILKERADRF